MKEIINYLEDYFKDYEDKEILIRTVLLKFLGFKETYTGSQTNDKEDLNYAIEETLREREASRVTTYKRMKRAYLKENWRE